MQTWIVKEGREKRIRGKHPWVFANELLSPENVEPGSLIKLSDAHGEFLAFGYGNPNSTISFRALSFSVDDENFGESAWLLNKLKISWEKRIKEGMKYSYRLCYSEADGLPGLIVDYYTLADGKNAIVSCQILTAGMNHLFENLKNVFTELFDLKNTSVVIRNDSSIRKLEGLPVEKAFVFSCPEGLDLSNALVFLSHPMSEEPITLKTDFLHGQKTGLFLDQSFNIRILLELLNRSTADGTATRFRILDLCCYVGQWSAQVTQFLKSKGIEVEVTLMDASEKSLKFAEENIKNLGADSVKMLRGDVLRDLPKLPSQSFDIVISDPPAFLKNKKEISQGKHGYLKLNTEAFRLVAKDGFVVSCSCSGHLSEDDFSEILKKAVTRSKREMIAIARGGHAADHPVLDRFPEGRYLKMVLHRSL